MRLFIAVPVPNNLISRIMDSMEDLKKARKLPEKIRPVSPENLHINLVFLGDQDRKDLPLIERSLGETKEILGNRRMILKLKDIISYPPGRQARMIWLHGEGDSSSELSKVKKILDERLISNGIRWVKAGSERFNMHVALARFAPGSLPGGSVRVALEAEFPLKSINLTKSTLTPQGPIYDDIFFISLINGE